ncbi:MAG: DUF4336 domain-containing protein [Cyanobacteria bacterium J06641_5]
MSQQTPPQTAKRDRAWPYWPVVPLYPYGQRPTLRREVLADTIWTFDQFQGIFYVVVPIRMTVVRLLAGGLLVYAPIAPTGECLHLMGELVGAHGPVKYIILPTVSGIEHKVFVGPFARHFPEAQVFVTPHQWSFPINLPLSWLGLPPRRTQILPENSATTPFGAEFDYALLGPIKLGLGPFAEVAFFHRPSNSLLLTDALISIPAEPPAILQLDPYPLLFHARDKAAEAIADTRDNRIKGWQRICLFATYFQPDALETPTLPQALTEARQAPDRSRRAYFGLYPFAWQPGWQRASEALRGNGRLLVAPVLQALIFNRDRQAVLNWVERIAAWPSERLLPCHFTSPLPVDSGQIRAAFSFLSERSSDLPLPEADFRLLRQLDTGLTQRGIVPPPQ